MRKLNDSEIQHIIALHHEGKSIKTIRNETGHGSNTINRILKKNNLRFSCNKFTPDEERNIVEKYNEGHSLAKLHKEFGRASVVTFGNIVKKHGVSLREARCPFREMTLEEKETIIDMWESDKTKTEISVKVDVCVRVLTQWMKNLGIVEANCMPSGERHHYWKGGRRISKHGYVLVRITKEDQDQFYCMTHSTGYVFEHRYVMAKYLGRVLTKNETVHHVNGDRTDNRLENLQLRIGNHGLGGSYCCADCGSINIIPVPLQD